MFDIAKSIEQKVAIQEKAVSFLQKTRRILLSWATGCGKSLAALKMVKAYFDYKPSIKGYVICKELAHVDSWKEDIEKHNMEFIYDTAEFFLYDSLHKYCNSGPVDFVVLDEVHALTPKRLGYLLQICDEKTLIISLSATLSPVNFGYLRSLCGYVTEYNIPLHRAIEMGIIPPPKVYVHFIELNASQRQEYDNYTAQINEWGEKYEETGNEFYSIKQKQLGSERKRAIADAKTEYAAKLIKDEFENSRYICFTGSQDQCEELSYLVGSDNYVHSGRSKNIIKAKHRDFNAEKIDDLFVVKMFRESVNLHNIEKGLIVQLDSVKLSFIQMLGRVFRSDIPEMHILIAKDTKDEVYLRKVMRGFDEKYLIYVS